MITRECPLACVGGLLMGLSKRCRGIHHPRPPASSFTLPEHIPVPNWHFWFADSHCHKPESKTHLALAPARRRDDQEKEKKGFCLELASYFVHLFIQFYMYGFCGIHPWNNVQSDTNPIQYLFGTLVGVDMATSLHRCDDELVCFNLFKLLQFTSIRFNLL